MKFRSKKCGGYKIQSDFPFEMIRANRVIKVEVFDAFRQLLVASWRERIVTTHHALSRPSITMMIGAYPCVYTRVIALVVHLARF